MWRVLVIVTVACATREPGGRRPASSAGYAGAPGADLPPPPPPTTDDGRPLLATQFPRWCFQGKSYGSEGSCHMDQGDCERAYVGQVIDDARGLAKYMKLDWSQLTKGRQDALTRTIVAGYTACSRWYAYACFQTKGVIAAGVIETCFPTVRECDLAITYFARDPDMLPQQQRCYVYRQ